MNENSESIPEITEEMRKRIVMEEQLKKLKSPIFSKKNVLLLSGVMLIAISWFFWLLRDAIYEDPIILLWVVLASVVYILLISAFQIIFRWLWKGKLERDLSAGITLQSQELQEKLEENFFTNLVKINFKYIDKYYLQTQVQANKSFILTAIAACISLLIIIFGIIILLIYPERTQPGYVATASGVLGEFIAGVFFYLYNRTIIKMGEYHEKLVLTQNIGLALRITEDLPLPERTYAKVQLVERLCRDINIHLTGHASRSSARSDGEEVKSSEE